MKTTSYKNAVVLTGGIATGKSTVCKMLRAKGFEIIDADKIAHYMLNLHSHSIASIFGEEFVKDGIVDRKALGKIIFSDKNNRKKLEEFLHPLIQEEILTQSKILEAKKKRYIVDIPLFFENKRYKFDDVLLVYAPRELQLKRLMARNDLTKKEANERLDAQLPIEDKIKLSKYIIENTDDLTHLKNKVDKFIKDIDANHKI